MPVHNTAIIDKDARIGEGVEIGPYAVIGKNVVIGDRTVVAASVHIENTHIGQDCSISSHAVLGGEPQVIGFKDISSFVKVGNNTVIREYVTLHRSSKEGESTLVGDDCFLMAYTHVAHDCQIGNGVIITNYTGLPGHVIIGDKAVISGYVGMHQFIRIGKMAMVSGLSRLPKDVLPFSLVEGNPVRVLGINVVGVKRSGMAPASRSNLKKAFKLLCHSGLNTKQALEKIKEEVELSDEVLHLVEFVETSERGVCK